MCHATERVGKPIAYPHGIASLLEQIGFELEDVVTIPLQTWEDMQQKDPRSQHLQSIARWFLTTMGRTEQDAGLPEVRAFSGLSMALFTRVEGWSAEQVEQLQDDMYHEIINRNVHLYHRL